MGRNPVRPGCICRTGHKYFATSPHVMKLSTMGKPKPRPGFISTSGWMSRLFVRPNGSALSCRPRHRARRQPSRLARLYQIWGGRRPVSCRALLGRGLWKLAENKPRLPPILSLNHEGGLLPGKAAGMLDLREVAVAPRKLDVS